MTSLLLLVRWRESTLGFGGKKKGRGRAMSDLPHATRPLREPSREHARLMGSISQGQGIPLDSLRGAAR